MDAGIDRWTLWRYVYLPTGEVTRSWVINEPPPGEPGPDGDGFELQVVEVIPLSCLEELRKDFAEKAKAAREYGEKVAIHPATQGKFVTRACAFEEAEWAIRRLIQGQLPQPMDGGDGG